MRLRLFAPDDDECVSVLNLGINHAEVELRELITALAGTLCTGIAIYNVASSRASCAMQPARFNLALDGLSQVSLARI